MDRDDDFTDLMERARSGDPAAIRDFLERFEQEVRVMVRSRLPKKLRPRFDSGDFVQAVWQSFFADPDGVPVEFENEAHLRGRAPGEVPQLIHAALLRAGMAPASLQLRMSELEAVQAALEWARPGDVLALPVHSAAARTAVVDLLSVRPP